jgi:deoxyribose-phosphate aldolase
MTYRGFTKAQIASYIDHTVLKPAASSKDIEAAVATGLNAEVAAVCFRPTDVAFAKSLLGSSSVGLATVIGFPHGTNDSKVKAFETALAVEQGANEIDMVIHIGHLIQGKDDLVQADIKAVVDAAGGALVKVILETSELTDEQIVRACKLSEAAGAGYVKTSTGFAGGGATLEDIKLMKQHAGKHLKIKASGGIKNIDDAKAMIEAGASRLGTSSGIAIIQGLEAKGSY